MASVRRVKTGWRARYRTPGGDSRSRTFARRSDAERFLTSVEHNKLAGSYVDPSAGRVTFKSYAEQWRAAQVHRPSTAARVEGTLRQHVYPTLGDRPLGTIRPSELQAWVRGRAEVLAPSTVTVAWQVVVSVFRAAVLDRIIPASPCASVKLPRAEQADVQPMTADEVYAVADAIPDRYRALILLAAGCGLRQGEALGLTVDRVDFLRRTIRIDRQMVTHPGQPPELAPTKTGSDVRTIPAPQSVLDVMAAHLARHEPGPDGLLFTNEDGEPIRRNHMGRLWRSAAAQADVEGHTFHSLRHFCASALIAAGCSVKVVQTYLGHKGAKTTLEVYAHLWPSDDERTREALDAALGEAPVSPACHEPTVVAGTTC